MGGRLFNALLIDKLRFYIDDKYFSNNDRSKFLTNIGKVMPSHYPDNAYMIDTSRHRISLEFTPTRYRTKEGQTGTNLIMPIEEKLYKVFKELGFYDLPDNIYNSFVVSKLDLTKNFYTQNAVPRYIKMFKNRKYRAGIKPIQNTSNITNTSLILSTLKKDYLDKNTIGNKVILFYDKVQELKNKAALNEIYLRVPLPLKEVNILPKWACSNNPPYLSPNNLHIIRCELQYATSVKLKRFLTLFSILQKTVMI